MTEFGWYRGGCSDRLKIVGFPPELDKPASGARRNRPRRMIDRLGEGNMWWMIDERRAGMSPADPWTSATAMGCNLRSTGVRRTDWTMGDTCAGHVDDSVLRRRRDMTPLVVTSDDDRA